MGQGQLGKDKGGERKELSMITSGSMLVRTLADVLGIPKLKYGGIRVRIDELDGKEITIKEFHELPDTQFGSNGSYLRIEVDVLEDGLLKPITVNSSSKDIMQKESQGSGCFASEGHFTEGLEERWHRVLLDSGVKGGQGSGISLHNSIKPGITP